MGGAVAGAIGRAMEIAGDEWRSNLSSNRMPRTAMTPRRYLLHYENRHAPLLPRGLFYRRVAVTALVGIGLLAAALALGMVGYRVTEHMSWLDAFANASMILSGMGPLGTLQTRAGKLFAGCYALFSGLAFITLAGVILAPFIHRAFHHFHLADDRAEKK